MLKRIAVLAVVGMVVPAVQASNLNVSVQCGANNSMTTGPGCTVDYTVFGELSDLANEGLALVGFDLELVLMANGTQAAPLPQADAPSSYPMMAFDRNEGITNPAGFGGTLVSGKLLQCGGGQNTIMNGQVPCTGDPDCPAGSTCQVGGLCSPVAPYPIGTVITGVAKGGPEVLLTGSFTAPAAPGTYELRLTGLFANAIRQGEDGDPFWATEQANPGTIASLTVTVDGASGCTSCGCSIDSSDPADGSIDARQPHLLTSASPPQGITEVVINFNCTPLASDVEQGDFTVTSTLGSPPAFSVSPLAGSTVTLTFDAPIERAALTKIVHGPSGTSTCIGYLPGDVDQDHESAAADVTALIDCLQGNTVCAPYQTDIDRSSASNVLDVARLIDVLNGASAFDPWLGDTVPLNCP
ncbi:MAG: hypothetical protein J5J06_00935 [Phycisphaerae bacterium]|nr:hypothetical protein [Phycisphaerae bacterium]